MARKMLVLLEDDLDGTELGADGGETVTFAIDGAAYEIDLSDKNAKAMRDAFGRYVEHARKATTGRGRSPGRSSTGAHRTSADRDETRAARAWLVEHGFVGADSRGRISTDNWERYRSRGQMKMANVAPSLQETKAEVPPAKEAQAPPPAKAEAPATGGTDKPAPPASRGNSTKAEKPAPKGKTPEVSGVASLLP